MQTNVQRLKTIYIYNESHHECFFLLVLTIRRLVQMRWMSTFSSMHVHPWLSQSSGLSWARTSRSVDVVLYLEFLLGQLVALLEIHLCCYDSFCVNSCLSIALVFKCVY